MEDPVKEVPSLIKALCQGSVQEQQDAIQKYFLPHAAFQHPLCRVPSMQWKNCELPIVGGEVNSRLIIMAIYRWYRILSPKIEYAIHSTSFDEDAALVYVNMNQIFAIWFIPFYRAHVHFVAVLTLTTEPPRTSYRQPGLKYSDVTADRRPRYYVVKQEDHYQVNDFVNFLIPGLGPFLCRVGQCMATVACLIGAVVIGILGSVVFGSGRAGTRRWAYSPASGTEK